MTIVFGYQGEKQCLLVSDLLGKFYPDLGSEEEIKESSKAVEFLSPKILITKNRDLIGWAGTYVLDPNTETPDLKTVRIEDLLERPLISINLFKDYPYNHLMCASREKSQLYKGDSESTLIPFTYGELFCVGEAYQFDEERSDSFRDRMIDLALNFVELSKEKGKRFFQELSNRLRDYMLSTRTPRVDNIRGFESYLITPGNITRLERKLCGLKKLN